MKIKRTKKGAKISLSVSDVNSAVMQFVCTCHPEFARGYSLNALDAQAVTVDAILAQPKKGAVNDIGVPGQQGFGVGICPGKLPSGMSGIGNFTDLTSDTYGNYIYSDGSVMMWIPAFFYKIDADMIVDIKPLSYFIDVLVANTAGYALHRAFYDGGTVQPGVFVDKFLCSNNGGIASSIKNGNPLSTYSSHNPINSPNGKLENALYGTIEAAKTRGTNFFVNTRFIFAALALLSIAHAQTSQDSDFCGWYHPEHNFPKGCNNELGDVHDLDIRYKSDGFSNCGKTGSANHFNRTTHNGQNSGVTDLNGLMWEVTPGITSDGKRLYVLNPNVSMKNVTGGVSAQTDLWGPKGIKRNYDVLDASGLPSGYSRYGSCLNTLSGDQEGMGWQLTGLGIALPGKNKTVPLSGSLWNYPGNHMCPLSGADWADGGNAGVFALDLSNGRSSSSSGYGFRSALYL